MNVFDLIRTAVKNSLRSKTRTTLTVLAIFIGAFTLTLTSGVGTGINQYIDTTVASIGHAETYEAGRHRFEGTVALATAGPFGYTVRVLPKNDHLASPAELGFVTLPTS